MIGQTISHYRILEKLGEGGMGVVYKAEDTKLKRIVALKFLSSRSLGTSDEKARFVHEAQAAAALDHPNICTVYEINEADGHTFIAMAYVDGQSLREKTEAGPLKLEDALSLATDIARGLQEAHEKDIVHRDIKSANIMVTKKGQAKITDFGLAKLADSTRVTKTGTSVGTAAYMSPEQARGEAADHRADIWSFGVLLYEAITGGLPFKGDHQQAVFYAALNVDPEPITALRTGIPMELERVVNKAMAKRPEDRYQHVDDMLVDLKAIEQLVTSGKTRGASGPASDTVAAGNTRGKRLGYVAGAVILTAAVTIVAFILSQRDSGPQDRAMTGGGVGTIQSLAVLPFDNLMNDAEQEYFVDGMHEALITGLSRLGSLRVISRTSVMRYKGTEKPIPEIAQELNVDALIEGSVLRVGDQVRVTAQLIDGATDEHLWADSYDRDLRNVLVLLNEVAGAIAGEIHAALTPQQEELLGRARPVDPDAYEALLRGMHLLNTFREKNVRESIGYFEEAIELDPEFASAHASLAGAYIVLAVLGVPPLEVLPQSRRAARRALELDAGIAEAHVAMGFVLLYFDRDWQAGKSSFRKALEIDPNNSFAHHGYADYLVAIGRVDESVDQVVQGRKCDPLSPMANLVVVVHLYIARRYDEAVAEIEGFLAINPDYPIVNALLRRVYWQSGRFEEANDLLRESSWGREPENRAVIDRGYASSGPRGAVLAVAELWEAESDSVYVSPMDVAVFYAQAGRTESAMNWLERADEGRAPGLVHMIMNPAFDSLRDNPRFKELRRRMKLPN